MYGVRVSRFVVTGIAAAATYLIWNLENVLRSPESIHAFLAGVILTATFYEMQLIRPTTGKLGALFAAVDAKVAAYYSKRGWMRVVVLAVLYAAFSWGLNMQSSRHFQFSVGIVAGSLTFALMVELLVYKRMAKS